MSGGAGTARFVVGRLAAGIGTVFAVTVLVFAAVHLIPGSYADIVLGEFASDEARAALTSELGLDRPLPVQYFHWLEHAASGDLGYSYGTGQPVTEQLGRRVPVTAQLTLLALMLTLLVGIPLALLAGLAGGRFARGASRLSGAVATSVPDFVLASVLVYLFSRYALGLRAGGYVPFSEDPLGNLRGMLLPAFTLSVFGIAMVVRTGRDAVVAVLSAPHVTAAVARGETTAHIVRHHVLRNAAIPVLTVVAVFIGYLMGGAVIVESIFSLPGVGQSVLNAINGRDYATVQGVVLVAAVFVVAVNMLAELSYGVIDPRVRSGAQR